MKDSDVELVRHFLIEGATKMAPSVIEEIRKWTWHGPGVWTDVDELVLASNSNLFEAALDAVNGLGKEIPANYLRTQVQQREGVTWGGPIPTKIVAGELQRLAEFVRGAAPIS